MERTKESDRKHNAALLKSMTKLSEDVPILIVCNKLDTVEANLRARATEKFDFDVKKWLERSPAKIVATSAKKPLYYRSVSGISFERFGQDFDEKRLELIGDIFFSDQWDNQNEARYSDLYGFLNRDDLYEKQMPVAESNFGEVIGGVKALIGTNEQQRKILDRVLTGRLGAIEISEWAEPTDLTWIDYVIGILYNKHRIESDTSKPMEQFFALVCTFVNLAFEAFSGDTAFFIPLNKASGLLFSKLETGNRLKLKGEMTEKIAATRKEVAERFLALLLCKYRHFLKQPANKN